MNLKKLVSPVSLFAVFSVLAFNPFSEEWGEYRSPNHDGKSSEEIPLWPKDSLDRQNDIVFYSPGYGTASTAVRVTKANDVFKVQELWKVTSDKLANHWSTPVTKDAFLYGLAQFKQFAAGPIKCIDLKAGKEKWSQPGFGPGNVILADGKLFALSDAGQLVLIDRSPQSSKELDRFQAVTGTCWSTPAISDSRIYVRSAGEGTAFELNAKLSSR